MKNGLFPGIMFLLAGQFPAGAQQPDALQTPATTQTPAADSPTSAPSTQATPAPTPARRHNVSPNVTPEKHGGSSHTADERETDHLGYHYPLSKNGVRTTLQPLTITTEKATLQAAVRNLDAVPDTVVLECYFIGEHVGELIEPDRSHTVVKPGREFMIDHSTQTVSIPATATSAVKIDSAEVCTLIDKSPFAPHGTTAGGSLKAEDGTKQRGWIVLLTVDGKVLAVRASSTVYEDLCKDKAKLDAFLASTPPQEASYRRTIGPFRDYR